MASRVPDLVAAAVAASVSGRAPEAGAAAAAAVVTIRALEVIEVGAAVEGRAGTGHTTMA